MPLASARVIACWIMEAWTGTFAASLSHHVHGFVWMDTVPLCLWCDGVATKWDRSETVRVRHPQFPRFGPNVVRAAHPRLRPRQYDDVMSLVVRSLNHCCARTWPVSRHDGPWRPTDTQRRRRAGPALKNPSMKDTSRTHHWCAERLDHWKFFWSDRASRICLTHLAFTPVCVSSIGCTVQTWASPKIGSVKCCGTCFPCFQVRTRRCA